MAADFNLTNQYISQSFDNLVQNSGSIPVNGLGTQISNLTVTSSYATTASYALNSEAQTSASYALSASHAVQADNAQAATSALTANSATTAGSATTATSASHAGFAVSSSFALNFNPSATASYANSALTASYAVTASFVPSVVSASYALNSSNSISASHAVQANSSITATTATTASFATIANSALSSSTATSASHAIIADSALTATSATTATSASHAINATTAISASHAGTSNSSLTATSASFATNSNTATSASHAVQANNATSATSATSASHAIRADISDGVATNARLNVTDITASNATFTSASIGNLKTITGSATIIGDQYIILNSDAPVQRFAGLKVYDSNSANTGSFEWDSIDDNWIQVETGGKSAGMLTGISGSKGSEAYPANNTILKGTGNHTIQDSNITDSGTLINLNSATNITGSLKITGSARNASTIVGNIKQSFPSPGNNQSVGLAEITGTNTIAGNNYTNKNFFVADFNSFGEQFRDYFSIEYYDSFAYKYGSEFNINGIKSRLATIASGSGTDTSRLSQFVTVDDGDGTGTIQMFAGDQVDMRLSAGALGIQMTGSVDSVDGITAPSFTGSLSGSATLATTASSIDNLTQNVQITGSLNITGSARNASTIVGNIKQSFASPGNNNSVGLAEISGTNTIGGKNYTNKNFFVADFSSFGDQFKDYFSIEYYDGFAYNYGTEFNVNGKKSRLGLIISGSGTGRGGEVGVTDNQNGTGNVKLSAGDQVDMILAAGNQGIQVSGSVKSQITALSIASTTASMDCQDGDMFTLTLGNAVDTHLDATNVQAGQTVSLKVTNNATAAGTLSFSPDFKFAGGVAPTVTAATSAKDILTFQSYDGTTLDGTSVLNLS